MYWERCLKTNLCVSSRVSDSNNPFLLYNVFCWVKLVVLACELTVSRKLTEIFLIFSDSTLFWHHVSCRICKVSREVAVKKCKIEIYSKINPMNSIMVKIYLSNQPLLTQSRKTQDDGGYHLIKVTGFHCQYFSAILK